MKRRWTFGAAAALAVLAAGTALATIPSADGVIHGCFKQFAGSLRLVEAGESCGSKERPISWNVQGPKGETGPTGPAGPQGPPGPRGPAGDFGVGAGLEKLEITAPPPIGDQTLLQVEQGYRLPQGCAAGAVPQRLGAGWVCGSGTGPSSQAILRSQSGRIGVDSNVGATPLSAELPAGLWAITAKGEVENIDREAYATCELAAGGTRLDQAFNNIDGPDWGENLTLLGVLSAAAPTQVRVFCTTSTDGVEAVRFVLLAIRVASLG